MVALAHMGAHTPRPADARVVLRRKDIAVPNHDVLVDHGRLLYLDSNHNRLVAVDRQTGREVVAVDIPGEPAFARGLARLGGDRFLVGSQSPAAVHTVDLEAGRIVDSIALSDDRRDSVFAIALLPEGFDSVPARSAGLAEVLC